MLEHNFFFFIVHRLRSPSQNVTSLLIGRFQTPFTSIFLYPISSRFEKMLSTILL